MPTSIHEISNYQKLRSNERGFSLIEILVALLLAALIFMVAVPGDERVQDHRDLKTAVDDIDRSIRFAANEAVLRNTVVRLRIDLEKLPIEYNVEYGPPGNLPLPDMPEKVSRSLEEEKADQEKLANLDKQFTKVEEFAEIRHELNETVEIIGVASTSQNKLIRSGTANIYFYPTGEKDGAIIFFATQEELAFLEVQPFLATTSDVFETIRESRARQEDVILARMEEIYKEWLGR